MNVFSWSPCFETFQVKHENVERQSHGHKINQSPWWWLQIAQDYVDTSSLLHVGGGDGRRAAI